MFLPCSELLSDISTMDTFDLNIYNTIYLLQFNTFTRKYMIIYFIQKKNQKHFSAHSIPSLCKEKIQYFKDKKNDKKNVMH